ncbi:hypothetical protein U1Q18_051585 [Sarracenia purpurea var. burkii]
MSKYIDDEASSGSDDDDRSSISGASSSEEEEEDDDDNLPDGVAAPPTVSAADWKLVAAQNAALCKAGHDYRLEGTDECSTTEPQLYLAGNNWVIVNYLSEFEDTAAAARALATTLKSYGSVSTLERAIAAAAATSKAAATMKPMDLSTTTTSKSSSSSTDEKKAKKKAAAAAAATATTRGGGGASDMIEIKPATVTKSAEREAAGAARRALDSTAKTVRDGMLSSAAVPERVKALVRDVLVPCSFMVDTTASMSTAQRATTHRCAWTGAEISGAGQVEAKKKADEAAAAKKKAEEEEQDGKAAAAAAAITAVDVYVHSSVASRVKFVHFALHPYADLAQRVHQVVMHQLEAQPAPAVAADATPSARKATLAKLSLRMPSGDAQRQALLQSIVDDLVGDGVERFAAALRLVPDMYQLTGHANADALERALLIQ